MNRFNLSIKALLSLLLVIIVFAQYLNFQDTGVQANEPDIEIQPPVTGQELPYALDEIIVVTKGQSYNAYNFDNKTLSLSSQSLDVIRPIDSSTYLVSVPEGSDPLSFSNELILDDQVEHAQPNFKYESYSIATNDTYRTSLWGLHNTGQTIQSVVGTADADIDAPEAWAAAPALSQVIVAVIDTGVAYNHPDIKNSLWNGAGCVDHDGVPVPGGCQYGYDFTGGYDNNPLSSGDDHGTHIAGIIGAQPNNNRGVLGVAPNVKIMSLKSDLWTSEIVDAIQFAENNGAKVINASWGASWTSCNDVHDVLMYNAIRDFNGLFVAAAGNQSANHDLTTFFATPVDYAGNTSCWNKLNNVLGVAATNNKDEIASYSDFGPNVISIAAPGSSIYSSTIAGSQVTYEDFEAVTPPNVPAGWSTSGNAGTVNVGGGWGNALMGDINRNPYGSNSSYTFSSPSYNLSSYNSVDLSFRLRCDTEYSSGDDSLTLEFSNDGVTFGQPITFYEGFIDEDVDPSSFAFTNIELDLPSNYITSSFRVRFTWESDAADNNYEGCGIDLFRLYGYMNSSASDVYVFKSGTSMAAPYVAGTAAFVWGMEPSLTTAQVRTRILNGADSKPSLSGLVASGRRLNLRGVVVDVPPRISGVWGDWYAGDIATFSEISTVEFDNQLFQSVRGLDNKVYTRSLSNVNGTWSSWVFEGGSTLNGPAMAVYDGVLFQSVSALDKNIYVRMKSSADSSWSSWVYSGGSTNGVPSLESFDGRLYQSVRALDNTVYTRSLSNVNGTWSSWVFEGGSTLAGPSIAAYQETLFQSVRALNQEVYMREKPQ